MLLSSSRITNKTVLYLEGTFWNLSIADVFWFTLFHEIGHILNKDIEERLIDYEFSKSAVEDRADGFAENTLIEPDQYRFMVEIGDFSLPRIRQFCAEQNIPTFILIGRLQRDDHLKYHQYSDEKIRYQLDNIEKSIQ